MTPQPTPPDTQEKDEALRQFADDDNWDIVNLRRHKQNPTIPYWSNDRDPRVLAEIALASTPTQDSQKAERKDE